MKFRGGQWNRRFDTYLNGLLLHPSFPKALGLFVGVPIITSLLLLAVMSVITIPLVLLAQL